MKKKIIVFDFDGTIADSLDSVVEILLNISKKTKYKLSKEKIKDYIRNKSLKDLIKEYKISKLQLFFLLIKARKDMQDKTDKIITFDGIKELLEKLSKKYKLILLTSNKKTNVNRFLEKEKIEFFSEKYFKSSLFGKDKILKKIIKKNNLKIEEIIYIGDEIRDIESCKKINCDIISVNWGFNSKELLKKYNPNYIISKPEELIDKLKN